MGCVKYCRPDAPDYVGVDNSFDVFLSGGDVMACMVIFRRCVDFHSMNDMSTLDESESYLYAKLQSGKPVCIRR